MQVVVQFYILASVLFGSICTENPKWNLNISNSEANKSQKYLLTGSSNNDISNERKEEVPEVSLTYEDERIANHPNLNLLPLKCGLIEEPRIVGGDVAEMYQFPWMAIIAHKRRDNGRPIFGCGGSIINKRYVLTAAHCVKNKNISFVLLGEYDTTQKDDCVLTCESHIQNLTVISFVIHENYRRDTTVANDIALLRLSDDVEIRRNVDYICLPTTTELHHRVLDNNTATISGWGITENSTLSNVLRVVELPIYTDEECASIYKSATRTDDPNITTNLLCAGAENKNICTGDSGGPLILVGNYNGFYGYIQYGVATYGNRLCSQSIPGLFTDLRKYMGWILDNIRP